MWVAHARPVLDKFRPQVVDQRHHYVDLALDATVLRMPIVHGDKRAQRRRRLLQPASHLPDYIPGHVLGTGLKAARLVDGAAKGNRTIKQYSKRFREESHN